jgi:AcrR family transcriptional regulator
VASEPPRESTELPDELARLPHGRHGLPPEFVERNQSQRLLASLIRIVAEHGYNGATITAITDGAGVTTRTFYKYFESVEACYLAAFDALGTIIAERLAAAWASEEEWPLRVRAALAASLDLFSESPELAALMLSEPFVAGAAISRRYQEDLGRLAVYLGEGRSRSEQGDVLPPTTERGLLGSIASQIARKVSAGEATDLTAMLPDLTQFALTPYLGAASARKISRRR